MKRVLTGLAAAAALLVAVPSGTAFADTPPAPAERVIEAVKVFPYLDKYYGIPAADRTLIAMVYIAKHAGQPATDVPIALVVGDKRIPVPVAADGRMLRLPTAAELAAHAKVAVTPTGKPGFSIGLTLDSTITPAKELNAAECAKAVEQANGAMARAAGFLAFALPKVKATGFPGVQSGVAVMADGKTEPLPVVKGMVQFDPGAMPGARTLRLNATPSKVSLE